jgi:hypothetical protein
MKIIRSIEPGDRYRYDFDLCPCTRGSLAKRVSIAATNLKHDLRAVRIPFGQTGLA